MRIATLCFIITLSISTVTYADFFLLHDATYSLPGNTIPEQLSFGDIDADGHVEILVIDTLHTLFLYSPVHDSVLFSRTFDTSTAVGTVLLADANRDSVPDIMYIQAIMHDSAYPANTPLEWRVTLFDGASQFADSSVAFYWSTNDTAPAIGQFGYLAACLQALDRDSDGYTELLLSYSSSWINCPFGFLCSGGTEGTTILFHSFPDSVVGTLPVLSLSGRTGIAGDASSVILLTNYKSHFTEIGPDMSEGTVWISSLNQDGAAKTLIETPSWLYCRNLDQNYLHTIDAVQMVGDIDQTHPGCEALVGHWIFAGCVADSPYVEGSLGLYAIPTADSLAPLWSSSVQPSHYNYPYCEFLFHPDLPGHFFAFSRAMDTLYLFRGHDGTVSYGITDIPAGNKYWDTFWPDSTPRLVALDGDQISIYRLDIATDVNDFPPNSLPSSFTLGTPYPNPFNAELSIPVTLARKSDLTVEIINLLGESVTTLSRSDLPAGETTLTWNASNFASGIYLIHATAGTHTHTAKVILLK